jgi:hypothetical protein
MIPHSSSWLAAARRQPHSLLVYGASTLVAGLMLFGCNRPAQAPPADTLATSVAATLTAQPITVPPTFTPSPTAVANDTPSPTPTAEPTASSTPTATEESLPEEDPRSGLELSSPDYEDSFSQQFSFFEFSDEQTATIVWESGRLRASDNLADGFLWWSTTARLAEDFYVEVSAEVGDCSGKDAYGVAIRVGGTNFDQGYTLEVACDGSFRIRKFVSQEAPRLLLNWTTSGAIQSGPNVSNTIGILVEGSQLYPIANGELLLASPIEDRDYASGYFSLFPSAAVTDGLTIFFDDFKIWYLSP